MKGGIGIGIGAAAEARVSSSETFGCFVEIAFYLEKVTSVPSV
jgi:hypothetical protein